MTCKDCFHYNACNKFAANLGLPTTDKVGANEFCGCYKSAADVVEVVRCKDCAVPHNRWTGCPKMNGTIMPPDGFCSFGERKADHDG